MTNYTIIIQAMRGNKHKITMRHPVDETCADLKATPFHPVHAHSRDVTDPSFFSLLLARWMGSFLRHLPRRAADSNLIYPSKSNAVAPSSHLWTHLIRNIMPYG